MAKMIVVGNKYYVFTNEDMLEQVKDITGRAVVPYEVIIDVFPKVKGYQWVSRWYAYSGLKTRPIVDTKTAFATLEECMAYVEELYKSVLDDAALEALYTKRVYNTPPKQRADAWGFSITTLFE